MTVLGPINIATLSKRLIGVRFHRVKVDEVNAFISNFDVSGVAQGVDLRSGLAKIVVLSESPSDS